MPDHLKWRLTGRTLGSGGQAQVHEVADKENPDAPRLAIKVLTKGRPAKAYERFHREISAIGKLDHPNVIKIVDHSDVGAEFQYYVMEYFKDAKTLKSILEGHSNPFFRNSLTSLDLFVQLAEAIVACSGQGIFHRDISPANILVLPDSSIKLIDFGICQICDKETITLTDEAVGTVNYRPPECDSRVEGQISEKSDIYSAGKILWSAITGQRAFAREKPVFTSKSLQEIFPEHPETWHLAIIFSNTIRNDPDNRWYPHQAAAWARRPRMVIQTGRLPLEKMLQKCSICGIGSLQVCQKGHQLFSNPMPKEYVAVECEYCGHCFVINRQTLLAHYSQRQSFE